MGVHHIPPCPSSCPKEGQSHRESARHHRWDLAPHRESEIVDRSREDICISNNLTSTSIVSSHLVLGPIYDDAPILDDFVLPLDKTMAMVE